jgi:uncharacterized protein YecT (DUF1311 family)
VKNLVKSLVLAALALAMTSALRAQTIEQQFQRADAELNRVYQALKAKLPDDQMAALKVDQRQWLAGSDGGGSQDQVGFHRKNAFADINDSGPHS